MTDYYYEYSRPTQKELEDTQAIVREKMKEIEAEEEKEKEVSK